MTAAPADPAGSGTAALVGVDVGGTKILAIGLDAEGQPVGEPVRAATPRGPDQVVAAIADVVGSFPAARAVGMGIPGLVDRSGTLRVGPNLPGIVDLEVGDRVRDLLRAKGFDDVTVTVDNDANCAAWAEARVGAAAGAVEMLLITLGTGIGGGVVAGGALQRGANGFAGEPGHMVVDPDGPPCPCGRRGCWERYASGSGLGRLAREEAEAGRADTVLALAGGSLGAVRGEHVTKAAAAGDAEALGILDTFGWWAGLGLANLAALLDPGVIVVGGGLVEAGELVLGPTRRWFGELLMGAAHRPAIPVIAASLGERAGAIGAGLLAAASQPG